MPASQGLTRPSAKAELEKEGLKADALPRGILIINDGAIVTFSGNDGPRSVSLKREGGAWVASPSDREREVTNVTFISGSTKVSGM